MSPNRSLSILSLKEQPYWMYPDAYFHRRMQDSFRCSVSQCIEGLAPKFCFTEVEDEDQKSCNPLGCWSGISPREHSAEPLISAPESLSVAADELPDPSYCEEIIVYFTLLHSPFFRL